MNTNIFEIVEGSNESEFKNIYPDEMENHLKQKCIVMWCGRG